MNEINWPTVIMSVLMSTITVYFFTNHLLNKFLIKLGDIDKEYNSKMMDAVVEIVNKSLNKSR